MKINYLLTFCLAIMTLSFSTNTLSAQEKVRLGILGLVHDHIGFMGNPDYLERVEVVGVAEANEALLQKHGENFGWSGDILYANWERMLEETQPEAVMVFSSAFDHLRAVQLCAPLGIHVMVEKPFAVNMEHAREMARLAEENGILLLTNYETSWYGSNYKAYEIVHEKAVIGPLRKIVVHDGHYGPKELGCSEEFLEWLLDPVQNGGGALTDFGCYGANLITWLMQGEKPLTVSAVTQQIKTDTAYARVDDEATILLTYPQMQGVIQASWNWPYNRKDMEVYGENGYVHPLDGTHLRFLPLRGEPVLEVEVEAPSAPHNNPCTYLAAAIHGEVEPEGSLHSLANNLIVTEILDAARESARSGKVIKIR